MELSSGQQRLLFVIVVLLLAGLGVYLVGTHHGTTASPPPKPTVSAAPVTTAPTTAPAATNGSGGVDIYQWLPFSQQDLTAASRVTVAFAGDWETWSYTEPAPAYAAKMSGLVTSELSATLENDYATPGVAALRSTQKQVSTSSGGIASISTFGSGTITFVVNVTQQLGTTSGTTHTTKQYTVTVVSGPDGWQVNDIELAGVGNQ
jgi:hypothetical protein